MNLKLRAARELSEKTQEMVAKEIMVSVNAYQRYEYGERIPNAYIVQRLAKALGTTVEAIFPLP